MLDYPSRLWFFICKSISFFSGLFFLLSFSLFSFLSFGSKGQEVNVNQDSQYPGVVRIIIPGHANGTGFFTTPDVIIADFHVVDEIRESIEKKGLFFANDTIGFISRADIKIRSVDDFYDLAALKIEGYRSPIFLSC